MTTLILDENHLSENGHLIPDPSAFLKNLPARTEITLVLKTHDALYHLCPIRKTVPYLKSAEFPSGYWVGERIFPKGRTLVGGIAPSPFMLKMAHLLTEHPFALKGIFLWADLVTQAYGPLPLGWALVWHDDHLMICHDGILRVSRPCYLPFAQELPIILRYLKRFGYLEEMPLTLLKTSIFTDALPPFVRQETRAPHTFSPEGFIFHIPELMPLQRLYTWPHWIRKMAYAATLFAILGTGYLSWQIKTMAKTSYILKDQISHLPTKDSMDETKREAFAVYCRLSKDKPDLLPLLRQLIPLIKGEAVATHLHWTANPMSLTLHLEFNPSAPVDQILLTLQSELQGYLLTWRTNEEESLKGTLIIEKQEK